MNDAMSFDYSRLKAGIADPNIRIDYYTTAALRKKDGELATAMFDAYEANEKEWDEATYCNQTTPAEFTCLGYALAIPLHPRRAAPRFPLPTEPLRMRHAQPARVAVVG